uniref:Uncharacterized protein n=1 Tax=Octopus bimaculoides TaxID=37653 RepID=A0A0L8I8S5_OCTBM
MPKTCETFALCTKKVLLLTELHRNGFPHFKKEKFNITDSLYSGQPFSINSMRINWKYPRSSSMKICTNPQGNWPRR